MFFFIVLALGLIYARLDVLAAGHAVSDRDNATVRKNGAHVYCLERRSEC